MAKRNVVDEKYLISRPSEKDSDRANYLLSKIKNDKIRGILMPRGGEYANAIRNSKTMAAFETLLSEIINLERMVNNGGSIDEEGKGLF